MDTFTFPGTQRSVKRMGYGAMQLAGPGVWGPPKNPDEAIAQGVNHIDTSDFYGPHVTNQLIKKALHPYPRDLVLVTKVGAKRGPDRSWLNASSREELVSAVRDNLTNLGLETLEVVNYRIHTSSEPIGEPLSVLIELQKQGLIQHLGISNATPAQVKEAQSLTPIVCVQNEYNLAHRGDDALVEALARQGIPYVPFFPLGGFSPLQSTTLEETAKSLEATPLQVALAWLLHRSPNILLIPGTSTLAHLRDNLKAATLKLPPAALVRLDGIASEGGGRG